MMLLVVACVVILLSGLLTGWRRQRAGAQMHQHPFWSGWIYPGAFHAYSHAECTDSIGQKRLSGNCGRPTSLGWFPVILTPAILCRRVVSRSKPSEEALTIPVLHHSLPWLHVSKAPSVLSTSLSSREAAHQTVATSSPGFHTWTRGLLGPISPTPSQPCECRALPRY